MNYFLNHLTSFFNLALFIKANQLSHQTRKSGHIIPFFFNTKPRLKTFSFTTRCVSGSENSGEDEKTEYSA